MSIYLIILLIVVFNIIWIKYKTNNFTKSSSEVEPNIFFVRSSNKNKNIIGFLGLITFLIGLGYKNSINFEILQYRGMFKNAFYFIILVAFLFNFIQARNTFLTINKNSIPYKIYGFIGSFFGGGMFIAIFTVLILIPNLDYLIIKYPAKEIFEKVKISEKKAYSGKGEHYFINIISKNLNKKNKI